MWGSFAKEACECRESVHPHKCPLHLQKRALYIHKRALYMCQRSLQQNRQLHRARRPGVAFRFCVFIQTHTYTFTSTHTCTLTSHTLTLTHTPSLTHTPVKGGVFRKTFIYLYTHPRAHPPTHPSTHPHTHTLLLSPTHRAIPPPQLPRFPLQPPPPSTIYPPLHNVHTPDRRPVYRRSSLKSIVPVDFLS